MYKDLCFVAAFLCYLVVQSNGAKADHSYRCVDENGKPVEWFIMYKMPNIRSSPNKLRQFGESFVYLSSRDGDKIKWRTSEIGVTDSNSPLSRILEPLYLKANDDKMHIMYNDQPPIGEDLQYRGHTKGVVAFNGKTGFWLVHSVPRFPPAQSNHSYSYPNGGKRFGQAMTCITLNRAEANKVGKLLMYVEPNVYSSSNGTEELAKRVKDLARMTAGAVNTRLLKDPAYIYQNLTDDDTLINAYGKSRHFNADIYSKLLTDKLDTGLNVNTWLNTKDPMPADCEDKYHVDNVRTLRIPDTDETFSTAVDHSKWAVSQNPKKPWTCVSGINRTKFQEKRGGGAVCFKNAHIWKAFNSMIVDTEGCPVPGA